MLHARDDYNRIQDPENKIGADEPVMLFRAQDIWMPQVLAFYANCVELTGGDPNIIAATRLHVQRAIEWQQKNGKKSPDMAADQVVQTPAPVDRPNEFWLVSINDSPEMPGEVIFKGDKPYRAVVPGVADQYPFESNKIVMIERIGSKRTEERARIAKAKNARSRR